MNIETVTLEFLRAGPRHNQLVSPLTQYLAVCGDAPVSRVTLPYEHGELERRLQELQYAVTSAGNGRRLSEVLDQTGRDIARLLSSVDGVVGAVNPQLDTPDTLTHLRIVLSASELAMLPFETSKSLTANGAGTTWLALQSRAPVCITRHIRSVSGDGVPWPTRPRILFIAGPDTPADQHRAALETAFWPWRDGKDSVAALCQVLVEPTLSEINQTLVVAATDGKPFTHVHLLAHGMQVDHSDRYSPVAVLLNEKEEAASGERLAAALTHGACGSNRLAVVTLASCDSGRQTTVRTTDASIAHELHDHGVPLVIASQFPLSKEGSVPFVAAFYAEHLWGRHPLVSMYDVRHRLFTEIGDTHDWASLVVYEALPGNLHEKLEEVRYWQARRALDGALKKLEDAPRTSDVNEMTSKSSPQVREVDACIRRMPTTGPFALECAGWRASAYKRRAQAAMAEALAKGEGEIARELLDECLLRLVDAREEYWRAARTFLSHSSERIREKSNLHWLLGQFISLDVVLGQPVDLTLLTVAEFAAKVDLDSHDEVEREWARASMMEFVLLRLAHTGVSDADRAAIAAKAIDHARTLVGNIGRRSDHVRLSSRQLARYATWWGNSEHQWALDRLGIRARPHWHATNGVVPTAVQLLAVLNGEGAVDDRRS